MVLLPACENVCDRFYYYFEETASTKWTVRRRKKGPCYLPKTSIFQDVDFWRVDWYLFVCSSVLSSCRASGLAWLKANAKLCMISFRVLLFLFNGFIIACAVVALTSMRMLLLKKKRLIDLLLITKWRRVYFHLLWIALFCRENGFGGEKRLVGGGKKSH